MTSTVFKGVVHGKTIELEQEPGLPDGETVNVAIQRMPRPQPSPQEPVPQVETWCERIVFDKTVSPTEKVVKGTPLLAEALVVELQEGKSDAELLKGHPELTADDVAALRHYARVSPGLRQSFGAWADEAEELDEYLAWTRQNRKLKRREIEE
jgi:uncharacterized protein (DUF433 family)